MIKKLMRYVCFLSQINVLQFFYLNYLCKKVVRRDKSKIIPYRNAVIELGKDSKIYLENGDIELGCDRLGKSKAETRIRMRKGAIWKSEEGCKVSYGCTIEVFSNAIFESKYFTMNCNSVTVVSKQVSFGHDVMIGRNVVIYDSDFHQILNDKKEIINQSQPVEIGNHVWLGVNVILLKGATIGSGCVIGAQAVVAGKVDSNTIYQVKREKIERVEYGNWNRKYPVVEGD